MKEIKEVGWTKFKTEGMKEISEPDIKAVFR